MDETKYNNIVEDYKKLRKNSNILDLRFVIKSLCEKYCKDGFDERIIHSLVSWIVQQETKLKINQVNWERALDESKKENIPLLLTAIKLDISPAIVAKKLLSLEKDPKTTKSWLSNSSSIPNGKLAFEVMMSQYTDVIFGQHSHHITANVGSVFELEVEKILDKAGVDFSTEKQLREREYDVTPDFKLNIPMAISLSPDQEKAFILPQSSLPSCQMCQPSFKENLTHNNGMIIVNWVECKSLFASVNCHKEYLKNQFNPYSNRFGKGLIIYRYGCVQSIIKSNPNLIVVKEISWNPERSINGLNTISNPVDI